MVELALLNYGFSRLAYWKIIIVVVLIRSFHWSSAAITTGLILYSLFLISQIRPYKPPPVYETQRFKFLDERQWLEQWSSAKLGSEKLESLIIPESFLVSEALQELVNLIVDQFINLWFTKISDDPLFSNSVKLELRYVIINLKKRLSDLDFSSFLVYSILPLISKHYSSFLATSQKHAASYSIESKILLALTADPHSLHEAVTLAPPGPGSRKKEKESLRNMISKILPFLLSENERNNKIGVSLTTEILSCTILANVLEVASEGDFFNQMIVKLVGDNMQHRDQIKRLRAALQQHTMYSGEALLPELSPPISDSAVGQWEKFIKTLNSRDDLDKIKSVIEKQQSVSAMDHASSIDTERLSIISNALDLQIASISNALLSLDIILTHPKLASVFREYLRQSKHELDFDMWKDIDLIKAPLEDSDAGQIPLMLEFSNNDDIRQIYSNYFNDSLVLIKNELRKIVESYVKCSESDPIKSNLYKDARKALFEIQAEVFKHMQDDHFDDFTKSERFGDLDLAYLKRAHSIRREPSLAFATVSGNSGNRIVSNVNTHTVDAIETAFERIMASKDQDIQSLFGESNERAFSASLGDIDHLAKYSGDKLSSTDFNRMSTLFENNSDTDSDAESINSDSADLQSDQPVSELSSLEIILAAPGDLSLAEQIRTLDNTIENLAQQDTILSSLLKKAELTNEVGKLKLLRRFKLSLEREIKSKEMQKQQYIVQENENSLYGKSRVNIQSCVFGNDESTKYVLYIIEVQKYSSEFPNQIVAGWIIARRFSQFYRLHEYLKKRIPQVSNLKFPKKSVQMLSFQKRQQIESRKPILQDYLQSLLQMPEVCSDPIFRSFLSSEDFHFRSSNKSNPRKSLDSIFNKFYGNTGVGGRIQHSEIDEISSPHNDEILDNIKEMEKELKQFDEIERLSSGKVPFVKPISDLLMTIFDLGSSKSWLRGRALLVILQQVLGSTIERTITQLVDSFVRLEEKILDILHLLKDTLFPNAKFRESPQLRTKMEQTSTRQEAMFILRSFMNETCSKIFGTRNSNQACDALFEMLQNDFLNKSLIFQILEKLITELFPEAGWNPT